MERHFFFPLLIMVPVLMSALAYMKSYQHKNRQFRNLSEFYLSLMLVAGSSWALLPLGSAYVILTMLTWMWSLRTFGLVTESVSKQPLFSKYHLYVLALGGLISLIFLGFDFSLSMVATPFALSIGLIGLTFIFQAYSKGRARTYGHLQHINFFFVLVFFVSRIIFPILIGDNESMELVAVIDSYLLLAFCASLYPLYAELVFEEQEQLLERVLQTRNRQLFSHSGFSEYKILAAGVSHEVNNALSIINAKIALMLRRNTAPGFEKDLQMLQNATNRIVRSIRGLREFIYPSDLEEVLDLGEAVEEVLELYGQRLSNHGVRVEVNGLDGKLVKTQKVQLEQVFLSLINNSVEALDQLEEKWIRISGKSSQGNAMITYEDSGPSRAEQFIPLLRDPLYAYHEFMDNDIRLVLAKEIIEKYHGTFDCVTQIDHSAFVITLPLSDAIRSTSMELKSKIEEIRELQ